MASMNDFSENMDEYNTLILPKLRERTLPFDGKVKKSDLALAFVLRLFSSATLASGVVLGYSFLFQHDFGILKLIHNQLFDEIARLLPPIPDLEWILLFIAIISIFRTLSASSAVLERKEYEGKSIL